MRGRTSIPATNRPDAAFQLERSNDSVPKTNSVTSQKDSNMRHLVQKLQKHV